MLPAKAMPAGSSNCVARSASRSWIVSTTWCSVALFGSVSTTLTESETWFATQTSRPSGRTATLTGSTPTSIRAKTLWLEVLITSRRSLVVAAT